MMDDGPGKGHDQARDARQQRLSRALRENLKRRKAQARQRSAGDQPPSNFHEAALPRDIDERDE
jgi:hypothetical protein